MIFNSLSGQGADVGRPSQDVVAARLQHSPPVMVQECGVDSGNEEFSF